MPLLSCFYPGKISEDAGHTFLRSSGKNALKGLWVISHDRRLHELKVLAQPAAMAHYQDTITIRKTPLQCWRHSNDTALVAFNCVFLSFTL